MIDSWRRQDVERAHLETIAHLPEQEVPSPETRWLILETLYRIEAMLRDLPEKTRQAFLMAQIAPDGGVSGLQMATDPPLSGASPLPH